MSALTFRKRAEPDQRLDLSVLTAEALAGLDRAAIERLPVGTTKEIVRAGDVFDVSGHDCGDIRFEGGSERFDRIGQAMISGAIRVEGDCGWYAGRLMAGGALTIAGTSGSYAGSGMSGGRLSIEGDAGDRLGGALAGEMAGMSGGEIHVGGRAGPRAGDRLRRGTIIIFGDSGPDAGSRMIAGTLIVAGRAEGAPGRLMKRGTLILCGSFERLSPTFIDNGPAELLFLRVMAAELAASSGRPMPFDGRPMRRLGGDMAVLGKGEIFVPV